MVDAPVRYWDCPGNCRGHEVYQPTHSQVPVSPPETASADRSPGSGTGGSESLRRFEQRLIPARTTAGQVEAWEAYAKEWLPDYGSDPTATYSQIAQGYSAGYDAAMARVRLILNDVQTEILRENR